MEQKARICVVGAGLVGKQHLNALTHTQDAMLVALVEPNSEGAKLAATYSVPHFTTLEAMFAATEVDGVILATPTPLHVEQGLMCIEHNCAVLVEKPLAVTAKEAEKLVQAAQANGVPLLVGHHRRYNPIIQKAASLISEGVIGDIRSLQATCWLYKPDDYFDVAPWRTQKGAGPISVNLAHDVDLMRHLCGDIITVQAQAAPSRRGHDNEDVAAAVLGFADGAIGTLTVSDAIAAPWSWELTAGENPAYPATNQSCYHFGGSKGAMSLPDLTVWTHDAPQSWWSPIRAASFPCATSAPLVNQIEHFTAVIKGRASPLVSGEEGLKTMHVLEAIQTACDTGQTVHIPR
ncbi:MULTISPECIES: Gfo/Idh/MocA family protein [Falsihalocynthiibacter]|uniref:Gfo/Idh/MocA family protein n=1 Tax=Falsihalocynthiibacter TaxID=2854182 RepID=UPI003001E787